MFDDISWEIYTDLFIVSFYITLWISKIFQKKSFKGKKNTLKKKEKNGGREEMKE